MNRLMSTYLLGVGRSLLLLLGLGISIANANDFLPPEQAFKFDLTVQDPSCTENCLIDVRATVAPEYYLYRERFDLQNPNGLAALEYVELPRGERKYDEFLEQEIEALRGEMQFQIRYSLAPGQDNSVEAVMVSQGCADAGLCYPPMNTSLSFGEPKRGALATFFGAAGFGAGGSSSVGNGFVSEAGPSAPVDEAGSLAGRLADQPAAVVLPVFFGLGLLLAFTPCTLPMLPIVSSLVVGARQAGGASGSRFRPFALAMVYVLGMALTYAVLGVLAGLSGQSLVMAMQQPAVLWAFGAVLATLGGALLMGYSLQLPSGFQTWLQEKTGNLKGGQFAPVLVMGILSALLLGPCVAPPLAGALLYIGQTGNAALGGAALFFLALGMGLPLVLFAAGAGAVLPKAGAWMHWVSAAFGFILIGVAVWTITPVTPTWLVMLAWAALGFWVAAALFYGAMNTPGIAARGRVFSQGLGVMFAGLGLVYLAGVFSGSQNLLQPLGGLAAGGAASAISSSKPGFERVPSGDALALLERSNQPVMLDFYADWCVTCKEFELFTLTDDTVKARLRGVRLVQVDVTANTADDQALLKHFQLFGPPAILFFEPGQATSVHKVIGFQNAPRFADTLAQVRPLIGL